MNFGLVCPWAVENEAKKGVEWRGWLIDSFGSGDGWNGRRL